MDAVVFDTSFKWLIKVLPRLQKGTINYGDNYDFRKK